MATGISYATARRRYESGTLPVPWYRLGRLIMVGEPVAGTTAEVGQTVVYVRVSSADQKADLDRQLARVATWATGQWLAVDRMVTEILRSLCARLFGRRGAAVAAYRARRAVEAATEDTGDTGDIGVPV